MGARLSRLKRVLLGPAPGALALLAGPTLAALVVDLAVRGGNVVDFAPQGKAIYGSSLLVSAGFWMLPLVVAGRLWGRRRAAVARAALVLLALGWLLPLATFAYGGQLVYRRVFHGYMGRDTLRLGIALRGTVLEWFDAWGGPWLMAAMAAAGAAATVGMLLLARRAAARLNGAVPLVPVVTFAGALVCFWTDNVDSRFLQAAVPDACFVHGVVHAARMAVTGEWNDHRGISLRTPAPLPPLTLPAHRPNVLVILTESVRADTSCSAPPPACRSEALDPVAAERVPLGELTTQTPNTFSACMILWTGLGPDADFVAAHSAPVLWEIARAVGYRTAYVSSQNPAYEDFGAYVQRAGIDVTVSALDLGGMGQEQLGAPDERATEAMLRFLRGVPEGQPWLGVLHLSNTHAPYRVDPALQPYAPHSNDSLGPVEEFHNQYRNSVLFQERTVADFLRRLRARADWDDTVVLFASDHGEQFREHGTLYHNHSLYDEELRVPGWLLAGPRALDLGQRLALGTYAGRRTYMQDLHETIVDVLGQEDVRATLPFAAQVRGRSLLRPFWGEPTALLTTTTAVWWSDEPRFGAMRGPLTLIGAPGDWKCHDTYRDPEEQHALPESACGDLLPLVKERFEGAR